jgi:hypothetical protein
LEVVVVVVEVVVAVVVAVQGFKGVCVKSFEDQAITETWETSMESFPNTNT